MMRPYHLVAPAVQAMSMGVAAAPPPAAATMLWTPYPNPASRGANVRFSLRASGPVELDLYSVAGQRLRKLASGTLEAGEHAVAWDGTALPRGEAEILQARWARGEDYGHLQD